MALKKKSQKPVASPEPRSEWGKKIYAYAGVISTLADSQNETKPVAMKLIRELAGMIAKETSNL